MPSLRRLTSLLALSFACVCAPVNAQTLYGIEFALFPHMFRVDPATGVPVDDLGEITVVGYQVAGSRGMATDPTTGELYAVVYANSIAMPAIEGHLLIRLNPLNASGTLITLLSQGIRDLAFDAGGTLYGVSGGPNQSSIPDTLFEVNKDTGALSALTAVGTPGASNRNHGIAFRPADPTVLYHRYGATGFETVAIAPPHTRTEIGTNDVSTLVSFALTWDEAAGVFRTVETPGGGIIYSWVTIDPAGVRTAPAAKLPTTLNGLAFEAIEGALFADGFETSDTSAWM